jgi:hypothetical protein
VGHTAYVGCTVEAGLQGTESGSIHGKLARGGACGGSGDDVPAVVPYLPRLSNVLAHGELQHVYAGSQLTDETCKQSFRMMRKEHGTFISEAHIRPEMITAWTASAYNVSFGLSVATAPGALPSPSLLTMLALSRPILLVS